MRLPRFCLLKRLLFADRVFDNDAILVAPVHYLRLIENG
jgi:hypothetical protein